MPGERESLRRVDVETADRTLAAARDRIMEAAKLADDAAAGTMHLSIMAAAAAVDDAREEAREFLEGE